MLIVLIQQCGAIQHQEFLRPSLHQTGLEGRCVDFVFGQKSDAIQIFLCILRLDPRPRIVLKSANALRCVCQTAICIEVFRHIQANGIRK